MAKTRHIHPFRLLAAAALLAASSCAFVPSDPVAADNAELRGTWITTTANRAVATPADTATSMRRLREIGINTVYLEAWKDGATQFPSAALQRAIGIDRHPALTQGSAPRDLLQEMVIEAHRNGLVAMAWFEYGFMAAHQSSLNRLRTSKPAWLSRDIHGNDVAPNSFVWLNPLHPDAQQLLIDIVLEAIDRYDLDGIQFDDRIVWPHVTMGYDDFTRAAYAAEHAGRQPPADHLDPAWMQWRAQKLDAFAQRLVTAVRARCPRLVISLAPAVYPWSWHNHLLAWPQWAAWTGARWDEFIPQVYRLDFAAFDRTWRAQLAAVSASAADRVRDLAAGIRIVGDGPASSWEQLRDSIELVRRTGGSGHVLWFSRGVLELYPQQLRDLYAAPARNPHFRRGWRRESIPLLRLPASASSGFGSQWYVTSPPPGRYRLIGLDRGNWRYLEEPVVDAASIGIAQRIFNLRDSHEQVELVLDRRQEMRRPVERH